MSRPPTGTARTTTATGAIVDSESLNSNPTGLPGAARGRVGLFCVGTHSDTDPRPPEKVWGATIRMMLDTRRGYAGNRIAPVEFARELFESRLGRHGLCARGVVGGLGRHRCCVRGVGGKGSAETDFLCAVWGTIRDLAVGWQGGIRRARPEPADGWRARCGWVEGERDRAVGSGVGGIFGGDGRVTR